MRPASIVNFERLYLAAIAIGLVNTILSWDRSVAMLASQPGMDFGPGFLVGTVVAGLIIQLLLWYFIARRGSSVAKWVLVLLFVLGLIFVATSPPIGGIATILGVVTLLLDLAAIWMLFRPDARSWCAGGGSAA